MIGDSCYEAVDFEEGATWEEADTFCRDEKQGILTELEHNDEKMMVVVSFMSNLSFTCFSSWNLHCQTFTIQASPKPDLTGGLE